MICESFCGVATLQVGVGLLSIVFLLVSWIIFAVNVFNFYDDPTVSWPAPLVVIIVFVVIMAVLGLLSFCAAYEESRSKALGALVAIALLIVFWLILSIISFTNNPTTLKLLCNHLKCPESFWLTELSYRNWRDIEPNCNRDFRGLKKVTMKHNPQGKYSTATTRALPIQATKENLNMTSSNGDLTTITILSNEDLGTNDLTTISILSTEDLGTTTEDITTISVLSTEDLGTTTVLSTEDHTTISILSTEDLGTTTVLSTEDITTISILSTEDLGTTTELSTEDISNATDSLSELSSLPMILSTEVPKTPPNLSNELSKTPTTTLTLSAKVPTIPTSSSIELPSTIKSFSTMNKITPSFMDQKNKSETTGGNKDLGKRKREDLYISELGSEFKTTKNVITYPFLKNLPITPIESITRLQQIRDSHTNYLKITSQETQEEIANYVFGVKFVGAMILFLFNFIFLLFSAFTLWNYYQELDWIYKYENEIINEGISKKDF